jgi:hypothetical protein
MDCGGWLSDFFATISEDPRISVTHVSLYMALFCRWAEMGCPEVMEIDRVNLMQMSKISARSTYDKCMNDLGEFGYVKYWPVCGRGKSAVGFKKL